MRSDENSIGGKERGEQSSPNLEQSSALTAVLRGRSVGGMYGVRHLATEQLKQICLDLRLDGGMRRVAEHEVARRNENVMPAVIPPRNAQNSRLRHVYTSVLRTRIRTGFHRSEERRV